MSPLHAYKQKVAEQESPDMLYLRGMLQTAVNVERAADAIEDNNISEAAKQFEYAREVLTAMILGVAQAASEGDKVCESLHRYFMTLSFKLLDVESEKDCTQARSITSSLRSTAKVWRELSEGPAKK